jgi:GH43 family beta-xylosidase
MTTAPELRADDETFVNPIVESGADPWVILSEGDYYYCRAGERGEIQVARSRRLQDIGRAARVEVWTPPPDGAYAKNVWAPELHRLGDKWYIYFAADDGDNRNHRMYVLEGDSPDPQGSFTFKGKIAAPTDRWAIDGTVLVLDDGSKYFVWSGWESFENTRQNIYIAPMDSPWSISGERVCISTPEYDWERVDAPDVNEAPEVLKKDGRIFIIYSASGSWTDDYCLGQLSYVGGNVLKKESWLKTKTPVFAKTADVFGPGHACFVKSRDGLKDWIVYHAARHSGAGWDRNVRAQRFTWNADGSPNFGAPIPTGIPIK